MRTRIKMKMFLNSSNLIKQLILSIVIVGSLLLICSSFKEVTGVVVDGKRSGPSATSNQSSKSELIDNYNTRDCGISDQDNSKSKFVNSAKDGQFPWLVSFQVARKEGNAHFCMGSFISDKWILSAAHCFADPNLKPYLERNDVFATAGTTGAYNDKNQNFTIKKIYYHSKFDRSSPIGFDVALIEINENAKLSTKYDEKSSFINTVCLPIDGKEFEKGQAVKLAGWGDTVSKDPKSKPENLLTTDLVLTDGEQCADIFSKKLKKVKNQYHSHKDFICADYNGQRDACQGDSGGSLLEYADGRAVAVGIVSYGLGCATKGVPGVYSRTSSFLPWIRDITQNREKAEVPHIALDGTKKS